jgi:hypothetical protein
MDPGDVITAEPYDRVTFRLYPPATGYTMTGLEHICGTPTPTNPSCTLNGNASGSTTIALTQTGCSDQTTPAEWSFVVQKPQ